MRAGADVDDRLRRIEAGEWSPETLAWLREGLARYRHEASGGLTLEDALGLSVGRGGKPWWSVLARRRRDDALRELVACFRPDEPVSQQAGWLQGRILHYQTTAWRFDCCSEILPERHRGTENAFLFLALKAFPPPRSIRQLINILQGGDGE